MSTDWIKYLVNNNDLSGFYKSAKWERLRKEVLIEHKYECQQCKTRGFYKKANTVHHVQYVKRHPELALSKTYEYKGKEYKNLIPLCHDCHEEVHGYRRKKESLTEERW